MAPLTWRTIAFQDLLWRSTSPGLHCESSNLVARNFLVNLSSDLQILFAILSAFCVLPILFRVRLCIRPAQVLKSDRLLYQRGFFLDAHLLRLVLSLTAATGILFLYAPIPSVLVSACVGSQNNPNCLLTSIWDPGKGSYRWLCLRALCDCKETLNT